MRIDRPIGMKLLLRQIFSDEFNWTHWKLQDRGYYFGHADGA